jgi:DNA-binding transcriptional MocR family regulator
VSEDPQRALNTSQAIFEHLEREILRGAYRAGDVLPSIRTLASELGVSPATVSAAFGRLAQRGLTSVERGVGTRIREDTLLTNPLGRHPATPEGVIDAASGAPDPELLPDLNVHLHRLNVAKTLYGGEPMLPEIRRLASEYMSDAMEGMTANTMIAGGALDSISDAAGVRLRAGDHVIVEDPGFAATSSLLRSRALNLVPVEIDDEGFRVDAFAAAVARGADAVLYSPRGQNPYGSSLSASRASQLRDVLRASAERGRPVFVIENDHASLVSGAPYHSLIPGSDSWVSVRSLSKSHGPDLRFSLLAGDSLTIDSLGRRQAIRHGWISTVLQHLVISLTSDPEVRDLVRHAELEYARRRERLLAALEALRVPARGRSGLNVMVPVHDEAAVTSALMASGWHGRSGRPYRHNSSPFIRLTPAALSDEQIDALAEATARAIHGSAWGGR